MNAPPLCRYCGKPVPKKTTRIWFGAWDLTEVERAVMATHLEVSPEKPKSRADVQRLTNMQVVAHTWSSGPNPYIDKASLWDGVSYQSEFFCSRPCVGKFAFMLARSGSASQAYIEAKAKQWAKLHEGEEGQDAPINNDLPKHEVKL